MPGLFFRSLAGAQLSPGVALNVYTAEEFQRAKRPSDFMSSRLFYSPDRAIPHSSFCVVMATIYMQGASIINSGRVFDAFILGPEDFIKEVPPLFVTPLTEQASQFQSILASIPQVRQCLSPREELGTLHGLLQTAIIAQVAFSHMESSRVIELVKQLSAAKIKATITPWNNISLPNGAVVDELFIGALLADYVSANAKDFDKAFVDESKILFSPFPYNYYLSAEILSHFHSDVISHQERGYAAYALEGLEDKAQDMITELFDKTRFKDFMGQLNQAMLGAHVDKTRPAPRA